MQACARFFRSDKRKKSFPEEKLREDHFNSGSPDRRAVYFFFSTGSSDQLP